jgi:acetoin utilization deacetylase AcuC-like enzyme
MRRRYTPPRAVRELIAGGGGGPGFCAQRPAWHHALRDMAMGFCLCSGVAIRAELTIRERGLRKVIILDPDIHHGKGTEQFFRQRPDVLSASVHQGDMYPGSGPLSSVGAGDWLGYTTSVPVHQGTGEIAWASDAPHRLSLAGVVPAGRPSIRRDLE